MNSTSVCYSQLLPFALQNGSVCNTQAFRRFGKLSARRAGPQLSSSIIQAAQITSRTTSASNRHAVVTAAIHMSASSSTPPPEAPGTPKPGLWETIKPYRRPAFFTFIAINVGYAFYRQYRAWKEFITLPNHFFLELDLEQNVLVERSSSNLSALLRAARGSKEVELHKLIKLLQTAKSDERVKGLLTVLGDRDNFGGMAQLQELRNALLDFRFHVQGRAPVYAYSNAFCEGGMNGTGLYYLASAADKVFMPPTGMLSLLGFASSQVFVKGLLDKFKVQPEVFRREEYKSALAPLTGTGYDAAHRHNLEALLGSLYDQVVQGIASARRLTPEAVKAAVKSSPLLPSQAMQAKLLDGLAYRDQVERYMLQQLPADVQKAHQQPLQPRRGQLIATAHRSKQLAGPRVTMHRYSIAHEWAKSMQEMWQGPIPESSTKDSGSGTASGSNSSSDTAASTGPQQQLEAGGAGDASTASATVPAVPAGSTAVQKIFGGNFILPEDRPIVAVVTAAGPIMQAGSGEVEAGQHVESHRLVRVLRSYRENPQVKAVVLRINSPGGSAVASDMIAREVQLLREAGKPVVACMGDVAASGGYYIAAPCNKILAQPGTITGSIGVIFMKLNVKEALKEYGVTGDVVSFGDNADWASGLHSLTPKQQQQVDGMISATYDDFLSVVAKGRGLDKDAVRAVAKGRVWSGSQAIEVGLVDEIGGLNRATDVAKQLAGLSLDPLATITQEWPPSRVPPVLKFMQAAGGLDESPLEASAIAAAAAAAGPAAAPWQLSPSAAAPGPVLQLVARAAAAAQLASMFWQHAAKPAWINWLPQQWQQSVLLAGAGAGSPLQQQQWQANPAVAAAGAAGVQQQLVSVLSYVAQQHNQPGMYCMDAELLARSC